MMQSSLTTSKILPVCHRKISTTNMKRRPQEESYNIDSSVSATERSHLRSKKGDVCMARVFFHRKVLMDAKEIPPQSGTNYGQEQCINDWYSNMV